MIVEKFVEVINKIVDIMQVEYTYGNFTFSLWQVALVDVVLIVGGYCIGSMLRKE